MTFHNRPTSPATTATVLQDVQAKMSFPINEKVLRVFLEVRAREDLPLEGRDRQDLFRYSLPLKRGRVVAKDLEQVKVTFSHLNADQPSSQLRKAATYLT